jgi:hypothetical protein
MPALPGHSRLLRFTGEIIKTGDLGSRRHGIRSLSATWTATPVRSRLSTEQRLNPYSVGDISRTVTQPLAASRMA